MKLRRTLTTRQTQVDQAKTAGTTEVSSVDPTAQSKPAAKQAIDDALKTRKHPLIHVCRVDGRERL